MQILHPSPQIWLDHRKTTLFQFQPHPHTSDNFHPCVPLAFSVSTDKSPIAREKNRIKCAEINRLLTSIENLVNNIVYFFVDTNRLSKRNEYVIIIFVHCVCRAGRTRFRQQISQRCTVILCFRIAMSAASTTVHCSKTLRAIIVTDRHYRARGDGGSRGRGRP